MIYVCSLQTMSENEFDVLVFGKATSGTFQRTQKNVGLNNYIIVLCFTKVSDVGGTQILYSTKLDELGGDNGYMPKTAIVDKPLVYNGLICIQRKGLGKKQKE